MVLDAVNKSRQEYFQNAFQKLPGVKVNLQVAADNNSFWNLFNTLEYDMTMSGWVGDYDDSMTFFDMWVTYRETTKLNTRVLNMIS